MTLCELLDELRRRQISLQAEGDALRVRGASPPDPAIRAEIRTHKRAILSILVPQRTQEGCAFPKQWRHIPELPPKHRRVPTQDEDGVGLRYRVCLFGVPYLLSFRPNRGPSSLDVVDAEGRYRAFPDLSEFYRWAWATYQLSTGTLVDAHS